MSGSLAGMMLLAAMTLCMMGSAGGAVRMGAPTMREWRGARQRGGGWEERFMRAAVGWDSASGTMEDDDSVAFSPPKIPTGYDEAIDTALDSAIRGEELSPSKRRSPSFHAASPGGKPGGMSSAGAKSEVSVWWEQQLEVLLDSIGEAQSRQLDNHAQRHPGDAAYAQPALSVSPERPGERMQGAAEKLGRDVDSKINSAAAMRLEGKLLLEGGNVSDARLLFDAAIAMLRGVPGDDAAFLLAKCRLKSAACSVREGAFEETVDLCTQVIKWAGDDGLVGRAYYARGGVYRALARQTGGEAEMLMRARSELAEARGLLAGTEAGRQVDKALRLVDEDMAAVAGDASDRMSDGSGGGARFSLLAASGLEEGVGEGGGRATVSAQRETREARAFEEASSRGDAGASKMGDGVSQRGTERMATSFLGEEHPASARHATRDQHSSSAIRKASNAGGGGSRGVVSPLGGGGSRGVVSPLGGGGWEGQGGRGVSKGAREAEMASWLAPPHSGSPRGDAHSSGLKPPGWASSSPSSAAHTRSSGTAVVCSTTTHSGTLTCKQKLKLQIRDAAASARDKQQRISTGVPHPSTPPRLTPPPPYASPSGTPPRDELASGCRELASDDPSHTASHRSAASVKAEPWWTAASPKGGKRGRDKDASEGVPPAWAWEAWGDTPRMAWASPPPQARASPPASSWGASPRGEAADAEWETPTLGSVHSTSAAADTGCRQCGKEDAACEVGSRSSPAWSGLPRRRAVGGERGSGCQAVNHPEYPLLSEMARLGGSEFDTPVKLRGEDAAGAEVKAALGDADAVGAEVKAALGDADAVGAEVKAAVGDADTEVEEGAEELLLKRWRRHAAAVEKVDKVATLENKVEEPSAAVESVDHARVPAESAHLSYDPGEHSRELVSLGVVETSVTAGYVVEKPTASEDKEMVGEVSIDDVMKKPSVIQDKVVVVEEAAVAELMETTASEIKAEEPAAAEHTVEEEAAGADKVEKPAAAEQKVAEEAAAIEEVLEKPASAVDKVMKPAAGGDNLVEKPGAAEDKTDKTFEVVDKGLPRLITTGMPDGKGEELDRTRTEAPGDMDAIAEGRAQALTDVAAISGERKEAPADVDAVGEMPQCGEEGAASLAEGVHVAEADAVAVAAEAGAPSPSKSTKSPEAAQRKSNMPSVSSSSEEVEETLSVLLSTAGAAPEAAVQEAEEAVGLEPTAYHSLPVPEVSPADPPFASTRRNAGLLHSHSGHLVGCGPSWGCGALGKALSGVRKLVGLAAYAVSPERLLRKRNLREPIRNGVEQAGKWLDCVEALRERLAAALVQAEE